jgi:hypothetical protein
LVLSNALIKCARAILVAVDMFCNAGVTSSRFQVFKPQSGFTHKLAKGTLVLAYSSSAKIASTLGMLGEWVS